MTDIPASLLDRIRARNVVLVAGLGCGELARLPGWDDLTRRLLDWLEDLGRKSDVRALLDADQRAAAVTALAAALTDEVVEEIVKDAFAARPAVPEAFKAVAALPWRGVITTGFDALWDKALGSDGEEGATVFLPRDADALKRHRGRFLLHLFGSASAPETLCVTPGELRRKVAPTGIGDFLADLYRKRTFVFVGFRAGDPDLGLLAERLLGAVASEVEHFWLCPGEPGFPADLTGMTLGLTPVPFEGGTEQAMRALGEAWSGVAAGSRPADDDVDAWLEIWNRDPHDDEPRAALARAEPALRAAQKWEPLLALLRGRAQHLTDSDQQVAAMTEVARLTTDQLGRVDDAVTWYRQALALDPQYPAAVEGATDLLAKQERWSELATVLGAAADAVAIKDAERGPGRAVPLLLRLADIQQVALGDLDAALVTMERAYALDARVPELLEGLAEQYRRRQRWPDLARILEQRASLASDPAQAAELRAERAALLAEQVGDVAGSIAELESLLATDPNSRPVLRAIEALYDKQGRVDDAIRALERLTELTAASAERLPLLRRLAAAWEARPNGSDRAAATLEQIVHLQGEMGGRDPDALRALARVHRHAKRWTAVVDALARQIEATDPVADRIALHASLAQTYEDELHDNARALEAIAAAQALGDERESTLETLARLNQAEGHWAPAVAALDHWARLAKEAPVRTEAFFRAGVVLAEKVGDKSGAEARFAKALEVTAGHVPSLENLAALCRVRGEHLRAARLLEEAEAHTQNRIDKVRLLYETATLYEDRLDDEDKAIALFSRALAVDPEHVLAAERLVELHTRREEWSSLEPVLDMLARKVDKGQAALAADVYSRLGAVARKLGNVPKALTSYEAAYRLSPGSVEVLSGFADLCLARNDFAQAGKLYGELLAQHEATLAKSELVTLYMHLGRAEAGAQNNDAALTWFGKALALDDKHRPSLEAIASLHGKLGNWPALVLAKRTLTTLADDEGRAQLLEEIGDLYLDKLHNPLKAISSYQAVLALQPNRRHTLHRILELYTVAKQWTRAAETLVQLADLERSPAVRAKYAYTAGVIHRDELKDPEGAVALFNRSLDDAPGELRSFEAIERLLADSNDFRGLARNYRKMIKRLPAEGVPELRLRLWNGLGEVALQHLGDRELATTALEVASSLDPDNIARHERLAELYLDVGPSHTDKAIDRHQLLVSKNPERLASYRALAKLYGVVGALDKQWCVAAALSFLRKAEPELQQLYEQHRPQELRATKRPFSEDIWMKLVHPAEDPFVAAIFILLGHFVAATTAQQHQTVGLRRKDRADLARDERLPAQALRYVAHTLDLPAPDLFVRDDDPQGLSLLNLQEKGVLTPAFVAGQGLFQRGSELEVVFEIAKRMAFLRPERFLRWAVPSAAALDVALRSALALGGQAVGNGVHNGEVDRLTDHLRRLVPRGVAEQLGVVGRKLLGARGEAVDVAAWIAAADLTAARVGFVLTNDLAIAARVISTEAAGSSPLPAKQRLKDLLAFSISEPYFAVRKALGLDIG